MANRSSETSVVETRRSEFLAFYGSRFLCYNGHHLLHINQPWNTVTHTDLPIHSSRHSNVRNELLFPNSGYQENVESSVYHAWGWWYRILVLDAPNCATLRSNHSIDSFLVTPAALVHSARDWGFYWRLAWASAGLQALHVTPWLTDSKMTSMIAQKASEMERIGTRTLYEMVTAWAKQLWDGVRDVRSTLGVLDSFY